MRRAEEGDTVRIHYIGTLDNGRIFDSTEGRDPLRFTIGAGEVFPALEAAVRGMAVGEVKNVFIPAADSYGPRRPENVAQLKKSDLPPGTNPRPGQKVQVRLADGSEALLLVTLVTDCSVTLDGNHPLAGLDLTFALRLEDIVTSTAPV